MRFYSVGFSAIMAFRTNCSLKPKIFTPVGDRSVMWSIVVLLPIITVLGLLGNFLSFVILKYCSRKVSSFFYIRCLTIFDSLSIIFTMVGYYTTLILHPLLIDYPSYRKFGEMWNQWGTCQTKTYFAFAFRTMSIWTIVIFTIERSIGIRFPMVSLKVCTVRVAKIIIAVLVPVSMLCSLNWVFNFEKVKPPCSKYFTCKAKSNMLTYTVLDFVMLSIVPAIIILICNIVIVVTLKQRRRMSLVAYEEPLNKKRDAKITRQLLAVSFAFIILTTPSCISAIINAYLEWHKDNRYNSGILADFYHISFVLFTVNLSINFLLYCFIGKTFRTAAISLAKCQIEKMRIYRKALFETVSNESRNSVTRQSLITKSSTGKSDLELIKRFKIKAKKNPP